MTESTPVTANSPDLAVPPLADPSDRRALSHQTGIGLTLVLVVASLSAIAPLATDFYLPAFPQMTTDLCATATSVQLTFTAFLAGITFGQMVFGTLSDRFGRMRPLVIGVALCVVASAVAAAAPTIEFLTVARFVQGFAGAAGLVIGRAIISDLVTGNAAAQAFTVMVIVGEAATVVSPFMGSLLVDPVGWRGILWTVCALALAMLVATILVVRESHPKDRREASRRQMPNVGARFRALMSRAYVGNVCCFSFAFVVLMAYISASPFVYQSLIGMTAVHYGILYGANALGLGGVAALSAALTASRPVRTVLGTGVVVLVMATAVLLGLAVARAPVWSLPIPIFVAVASLGLVLGNAAALAIGAAGHAAGTASAVLGAMQFGLAAMVSPLVSLGGEHTALPVAVVMLTAAAVSLLAYLTTLNRTGAVMRRIFRLSKGISQ